jgi:hypothetical protein
MSEYIVQIQKNNEVTHVVIMASDRKTPTLTIASQQGFHYASKFKSKERAQKIADKVNGEVVPSFGGYVNSTKSSVGPKQGNVNSRTHFADTMTAYRKNQY